MGISISDYVVKEWNVSKKPYYYLDVYFKKEHIEAFNCNVELIELNEEDFLKLYSHFVNGESSAYMDKFDFKSFTTKITPHIKMTLFGTHTIGIVKENVLKKEYLEENVSINKIEVRFDQVGYDRADYLKTIEINEAVETLQFALHEHYGLEDSKHNLEIVHKAYDLAVMFENKNDNINNRMSHYFISTVEQIYVKLKDLAI
jgi:hypothetical protein